MLILYIYKIIHQPRRVVAKAISRKQCKPGLKDTQKLTDKPTEKTELIDAPTEVQNVSPTIITDEPAGKSNRVLTVPIIAAYLAEGYNPAQISRIMGCSDVAVYRYMQRHDDELAVLKDSKIVLRKKLDYLNHKLTDSLINDPAKIEKASGKDSYIMLGIGIEKSELLHGNATQIIDYHEESGKLKALELEEKRLVQELEEYKRQERETIDITPSKAEQPQDIVEKPGIKLKISNDDL